MGVRDGMRHFDQQDLREAYQSHPPSASFRRSRTTHNVPRNIKTDMRPPFDS
jgi:hypothetical protein